MGTRPNIPRSSFNSGSRYCNVIGGVSPRAQLLDWSEDGATVNHPRRTGAVRGF